MAWPEKYVERRSWTPTMNRLVELEQREIRRRRALKKLFALDWATRRAALLDLREILEQDRTDPLGETAGLSINELRAIVRVHSPTEGYPYVLSGDLPEPWRTRFWAASSHGITMSGPGIYAHDWENFLSLWEKEHLDLAGRLLDLDGG